MTDTVQASGRDRGILSESAESGLSFSPVVDDLASSGQFEGICYEKIGVDLGIRFEPDVHHHRAEAAIELGSFVIEGYLSLIVSLPENM